METVRDTWTDERLDDFRGEMAEFRHETKAEFAAVRGEMAEFHHETKAEFAAVRAEMKAEFTAFRSEMRAEFATLHLRFDSLQRMMIQFGGLMIAALIGLIATQA